MSAKKYRLHSNAETIVENLLDDEDDTFTGLGDVMPPDTSGISPDELDLGRSIEMEHTDDPNKAESIAMDHLREDPQYYTKLHQAGLDQPPAKHYMVGDPTETGSMTGT